MKKAIIAIMTIIVMASCAEDSKLNIRDFNQESNQAIGFSVFTDKATRSFPANSETLSKYQNQFVVYSTKASTIDNTIMDVFNGDTIKYLSGSWKYDELRFWDKQANFHFVAISPSAKYVKYTGTDNVADATGDYVTKEGGYTLVGTNPQNGTGTSEINNCFTGVDGVDTDILTAEKNYQVGATHDETVDMLFQHILAKLNVTITKSKAMDSQDVYIKKIEIKGLKDHGTYVGKDYTSTQTSYTSGWTASKINRNYKLGWQDTVASSKGKKLSSGSGEGNAYQAPNPQYFIESIVMPQEIEKDSVALLLEYAINNQTYKYELNFNYEDTLKKVNEPTVDSIVNRVVFDQFMDRSKYNLKLTIDPEVIIFKANAAAWADDKVHNDTIR